MIDRTMFPIRRRKHARPQEILDAALSLFIEKGFAAARADEIAARAGACKGTLYLYFHSKEDLLKELISQRFSSRIAILFHEATDARASLDMLREVVATWQSVLVEGEADGTDGTPCGHDDLNSYFEFVLEGLMDRPAERSQPSTRSHAVSGLAG